MFRLEKKSYLVNYPLFRLAVFMAAGIFFFDRFLPNMSVWTLILILCAVLLPLLLSVFVKIRNVNLNFFVGIVVSVCFFIIGGILIIHKKNSIYYEWPDKQLCYYGVVETTPEEKGKTLCSEVNVKFCIPSVSDSIAKYPVNRNILLYFIPDSLSYIPRCGDNIVFYSSVSKPVSDIEFMGFDYAGYLFNKGISGTTLAFSGNWIGIKVENPHSIKHAALRCRDVVAGKFSSWNMDEDELAVVSALTIGDKSELTPELKAVYSGAGTSHVLALSGLHVGILSCILYFLLRPLRRIKGGLLIQSVVVAVILWIFAFISGLSPSVVRAVAMCTLYLVASVLVENGFCGFFSLSFTAFIMLFYNPMYLFDISFQLSFVAVLAIILFYPAVSGWIKCGNRVVRYIWNAISVSLAAQLGTLPLILYYFGTFPTYFLMANLVVGILASCILSLTIASLVFSFIPVVGEACVCLLEVITKFLNNSMQFVHNLQGAQITSIYFNEFQVVLGFVLLFTLYIFIRRKTASRLIVILFAFCLIMVTEIYKVRTEDAPSLFLTRSDLYIRNNNELKTLSSENGLYDIGGVRVGVMKSSYWKDVRLTGKTKLATLDYVYICRGFGGSITGLCGLFEIKNVIIDETVSESYRNFLKDECKKLNIKCVEKSAQASFRILL